MNSIDALVLVITIFNLILGAFRGAVWQVLRITSIVLGIWTAVVYGEDFFAMFPASFALKDDYGVIVARVVLFLSVYLVMYGITQLVKTMVDKVKLGSMDRLVGAALGGCKGVFFCCVLLYLQFTPLSELDVVHDQLYGDADEEIRPSVANALFLDYMKERIDEAVPEQVTYRVEELRDRVGQELVNPDDK